MSTDCLTCELVARRDAGSAPLWDSIWRTPSWDIVHSYNSGLYGWTVLIVRRHIAAVDEMTPAEARDLGTLLQVVSAGLKKFTNCEKTYVIQFAEAREHPHVHFHIVPRMADIPDDRRAVNIFGYLSVDDTERVSESAMNQFALQMRQFLQTQNIPENE